MRHTATLALIAATIVGNGCSEVSTAPVDPAQAGPAISRSSTVLTPSYDLNVKLRSWHDLSDEQGQSEGDHEDGSGFIAFRQPGVPAHVVFLDTRVRDLTPNTTYWLQRATDGTVDGQCIGTNWLTLGVLSRQLAITTDGDGNGRAVFTRDLSGAIGKSFDIHFRVIRANPPDPLHPEIVLASRCYQFVVR